MNTLSDRVLFAINKSKKSKSQIATECGVKPPSVASWINGRTQELMGTVAVKLSKACSVNLLWLITGKGSPDAEDVVALSDDEKPNENYIQIKEYGLRCSAGYGTYPLFDEVHNSIPATYRLSFFQDLKIKPEDCMRFTVEGDSMEPLLFDGDKILVNTADKDPIINNKVYVIVVNNEIKVKKLIKKINGDLIIRSENNSVYPNDVILHDDENTYFSVIGRVIEKAGHGGL